MGDTHGIFNGIKVLEQALDLRAQRHTLIASNIANIDTPNYKAFDLVIEEAMKASVGQGHEVELTRTQPGHLPTGGSLDPTHAASVDAQSATLRKDNNSVSVDKEMTALSENNLLYNALAQIVAKKFEGLRSVIQGGSGR
jgi:flagellar basal-body rod protein FlgB